MFSQKKSPGSLHVRQIEIEPTGFQLTANWWNSPERKTEIMTKTVSINPEDMDLFALASIFLGPIASAVKCVR